MFSKQDTRTTEKAPIYKIGTKAKEFKKNENFLKFGILKPFQHYTSINVSVQVASIIAKR